MHHFEAHELADSWELRAGLLDADPADASISACLRECAAALRAAAAPNVQPKGMTPTQVRDGIADWIETNINHREFWTPEVVELIRSIEINERAAVQAPAPVDGDVVGRFFHQVIHGDFSADNPDDLRLALAARAVVQAPAVGAVGTVNFGTAEWHALLEALSVLPPGTKLYAHPPVQGSQS